MKGWILKRTWGKNTTDNISPWGSYCGVDLVTWFCINYLGLDSNTDRCVWERIHFPQHCLDNCKTGSLYGPLKAGSVVEVRESCACASPPRRNQFGDHVVFVWCVRGANGSEDGGRRGGRVGVSRSEPQSLRPESALGPPWGFISGAEVQRRARGAGAGHRALLPSFLSGVCAAALI